jgi:hypothetical protein
MRLDHAQDEELRSAGRGPVDRLRDRALRGPGRVYGDEDSADCGDCHGFHCDRVMQERAPTLGRAACLARADRPAGMRRTDPGNGRIGLLPSGS